MSQSSASQSSLWQESLAVKRPKAGDSKRWQKHCVQGLGYRALTAIMLGGAEGQEIKLFRGLRETCFLFIQVRA